LSDKKPDLGQNPFTDEIAANKAVFSAAVTVQGGANPRDVNSDWFNGQQLAAMNGIAQIASLPGFMEVRFAPEQVPVSKSPKELLSAVEQAEIKTFGWPIGVTLQSRPEYRPRPSEYGIKAEVAISESDRTGRSSYDYWALTHEGDFYLLQSFFEDMRVENSLFFNTRIVRVAEALLFGARLYGNLGLLPQARISVRVRHQGLRGRKLASSSPNRMLWDERTSDSDVMTTGFILTVGQMHHDVVQYTQTVCAPIFQLFDFAEFGPSIYDDIVRKFLNGVVT
jgi:hypothetical protein